MARTPQRAKSGRARQASAARPAAAKKTPKSGAKTGKSGRRSARRRTPSQFFSVAQWRRRFESWLDHALGRFGIGIGIGLLAGLVVVLGFNRFNHWITQSPDEPLLARGELAIQDNGAAGKADGKQVANEAANIVPPISSPAAKTMEQLITDTQSEITEPDAAPSTASAQPDNQPEPPATSTPQPAKQAPETPTTTAPVPTAQTPAQPPKTAVAAPGETVAAVPTSPAPPIAPTPRDGDRPAWLRNAVALHAPISGPMIAIVLDDVGVNKPDAELALNLPAPITLSIMTYADNAAELAARAHERGHELMLHVPMQPVNPRIDPGPNALLVGLGQDELKRRLDWGLSRFPGFIGINNHMGSRFTQDEAGMRLVMTDLQARGLLFLDSRTIANSVGERVATEVGVPHIGRDVFLDDEVALLGGDSVERQLAAAERIAAKRGYVIAIGHPHPITVAALQKWMAGLKQRGFTLVPLSAVARRELGVAG